MHDPFDQFDDPSYVGDLPNWAKWVLSTIIFLSSIGLIIAFVYWLDYDLERALTAIMIIILGGVSVFLITVIRMLFD